MNDSGINPIRMIAVVLGSIAALVILFIVLGFGWKAYGRYQSRADRAQNRQQALYDAQNQTRINTIRISQQSQLILVEKQKAEIRRQNAIGIREAQDEIAKTLTPLYIQFEAVQAQLAMAKSQNHTLMWIPATSNATPVIAPAQEVQK